MTTSGFSWPSTHAGLQGRVDLGQVDAGGRRAQGLEQRDVQGTDRYADLQVGQVLGFYDGAVAGGDFTKTVVPDTVDGMQALPGVGIAHEGAQLAVHGAPDRRVVLEDEPQAADGGVRHQGGHDDAAGGEHFDAARIDPRQQIVVAPSWLFGNTPMSTCPLLCCLIQAAASTARLWMGWLGGKPWPNFHENSAAARAAGKAVPSATAPAALIRCLRVMFIMSPIQRP